jgi:hypothetical protein
MTANKRYVPAKPPIDYLILLNSPMFDNTTKEEVNRLLAAGYKPISTACSLAALNGNIEMLQWLREIGFPWDKGLCYTLAKRRGHKEVLQWLLYNE